MKKALALVLALVLALSMAVSAFAVEFVELKPAAAAGTTLKKVNTLAFDAYNESYVVAGKGGVYYVLLDNEDYKNIELTASGNVTAKLVEYDPTVFEYVPEIPYAIYDRVTGAKVILSADVVALEDATKTFYADGVSMKSVYTISGGVLSYRTWDTNGNDTIKAVSGQYAHMVAIADAMNKAAKTTQYVVKTEANTQLVELTVANNYTAAYTEGQVKIAATLDKKAVSATLYVIRDVTIWDYETVKWAANYDKVLAVAADKGYSDYETYLAGYKTADLSSVSVYDNPVVVSTTAFRAIEGEDLTVLNAGLEVEIEEISAAQKGVNFTADAVHEVLKVAGKPQYGIKSISFGFLGEQVVKSDYTITVETGYTYFDLREAFEVKVEEDDIVTYYLLKDGKLVQEIVVDYMTVDPSDEVVLEIEGSNATLGYYDIVLEVESTAEVGEENPNTGAESVVGVVAALAVVSVATAAAVSLKK